MIPLTIQKLELEESGDVCVFVVSGTVIIKEAYPPVETCDEECVD
jgi:hypothetical protein